MPELDERLGAWRDAWQRRGGVAAWQADELEDHLRCAWSAARTRGATDDEAWNLALRALGPLDEVHHEYTLETAMTLTTKLFGLALTVALLLAVTITGPGGVSPFLHVPSLVFVALLVGCGLLLGFGGARVQRALRASVLASTPLEPDEVDALRPVLVRGHRLAWVAGVLGAILGVVQCLANLEDPSLLGRGLATCILTLLYGALLAELGFGTARQWLENRRAQVAA